MRHGRFLAILAGLLLGTRAAHAEEPLPPEVPQAPYWQIPSPANDYRRGMRTAVAGVGMTAIGVPCALVGTALVGFGARGADGQAMGVGFLVGMPGYIGVLGGPPTMLVGSVGAARALKAQGIPVSPAPATVGWFFVGAAVGLVAVAPMFPEASGEVLLASGGAYVLAVAFGAMQMKSDTQAWRRSGVDEPTVSRDGRGHVAWTLTPSAGRGTGGLALSGTF